jgi:hypothetical protein
VNVEQVQEELARIVEVLAEDDALHAWFLGLKRLPQVAREMELNHIAAKMRLAGEDRELIRATELLRQPEVLEGVSGMLAELRGGPDER